MSRAHTRRRRLVVAGMVALALPVLAGSIAAAPASKVVRESEHGWSVHGPEIVAFVTGPATPPLGQGSVAIATPLGGHAILAYEALEPTLFSDLTTLTFWTYVPFPHNVRPENAPDLKIPVFHTGGTQFTTLLYRPEQDGVVANNTWQMWDPTRPGAVWSLSRGVPPGCEAPGPPDCIIERHIPVLREAIIAMIPDATTFKGGEDGALYFDSGSGEGGSVGYVDAFTLGVEKGKEDDGKEKATTFDFEPAKR
jgi:hypothetical protein